MICGSSWFCTSMDEPVDQISSQQKHPPHVAQVMASCQLFCSTVQTSCNCRLCTVNELTLIHHNHYALKSFWYAISRCLFTFSMDLVRKSTLWKVVPLIWKKGCGQFCHPEKMILVLLWFCVYFCFCNSASWSYAILDIYPSFAADQSQVQLVCKHNATNATVHFLKNSSLVASVHGDTVVSSVDRDFEDLQALTTAAGTVLTIEYVSQNDSGDWSCRVQYQENNWTSADAHLLVLPQAGTWVCPLYCVRCTTQFTKFWRPMGAYLCWFSFTLLRQAKTSTLLVLSSTISSSFMLTMILTQIQAIVFLFEATDHAGSSQT